MDWILWCVLFAIGCLAVGAGVFIVQCLNMQLNGFDDVGSSETDIGD